MMNLKQITSNIILWPFSRTSSRRLPSSSSSTPSRSQSWDSADLRPRRDSWGLRDRSQQNGWRSGKWSQGSADTSAAFSIRGWSSSAWSRGRRLCAGRNSWTLHQNPPLRFSKSIQRSTNFSGLSFRDVSCIRRGTFPVSVSGHKCWGSSSVGTHWTPWFGGSPSSWVSSFRTGCLHLESPRTSSGGWARTWWGSPPKSSTGISWWGACTGSFLGRKQSGS